MLKNSAKKIVIGTRGSILALAQSKQVKELITSFCTTYFQQDHLISITPIKTTGDNILDKSLYEIGGKRLFTKEIEEELIKGTIDLAVHSMKDMPAIYPSNLTIAAIPLREDPRDAFISRTYQSLSHLPKGAKVGTSSTRRKALLLRARPDLEVINLRGNINSRLDKLNNGELDAIILAVAGLKRAGLEKYITSIFSIEEMLPAVGQGALGVQCRLDDLETIALLTQINHPLSNLSVTAERAFLKTIEGSCRMPAGAYCQIEGSTITLRTIICSLDGSQIYQTIKHGTIEQAEELGREAGLETKQNAASILDTLK